MNKLFVIHLTCAGWHALSEGLSMRWSFAITCSGFARACHPRLLKRQIIAIHTWISPEYLEYYLAEACVRYNLRYDDNRFEKLFKICVQPRG